MYAKDRCNAYAVVKSLNVQSTKIISRHQSKPLRHARPQTLLLAHPVQHNPSTPPRGPCPGPCRSSRPSRSLGADLPWRGIFALVRGWPPRLRIDECCGLVPPVLTEIAAALVGNLSRRRNAGARTSRVAAASRRAPSSIATAALPAKAAVRSGFASSSGVPGSWAHNPWRD